MSITCCIAGKDPDVGEVLVKSLQNTKYSINEKLEKSFISLFGKRPTMQSNGSHSVESHESTEPQEQFYEGRMRRKAVFGNDDDDSDSDSDDLKVVLFTVFLVGFVCSFYSLPNIEMSKLCFLFICFIQIVERT